MVIKKMFLNFFVVPTCGHEYIGIMNKIEIK